MKLLKGSLAFLILALAGLTGENAISRMSDDVTVHVVEDIRSEATLSNQEKLPILVMFSAEGCGYCMRMEEEFLKPMLRSGDYKDKVIIRQIKIDPMETVRDFDGNEVATDEFAARYRVAVTPTLVFLDHQGRQLAEKMVGLAAPDFFGGFLDEAIDTSLQRLRTPSSVAKAPF